MEVMRQRHESQIYAGEEEANMADSLLCIPNPVYCSPLLKPRSPLKIEKKLDPEKTNDLKSKAKQVIFRNPRKSGRGKRTKIDDLYDSVETKFSVMERAEEVLINLAADCPSFFKCMLPSNVAHGFWLILPKNFCNVHLPRHDTAVILVDECGEEYKTNYLVERHGLSGGWRAFSLAHRLLKGDCLVFHLVESCKLKVIIVRVHGLDEIDAALCLMNLVAPAKRRGSSAVKDVRTLKKTKKCVEPLLLDIPQDDIQKNCPMVSDSNLPLSAYPSENGTDNLCSEVLEGPELVNYLQSNELLCC